MISENVHAPRVGAAALCALMAAGCGGPAALGPRPEPAAFNAAYGRAHQAGLAVLDAVAPSLSPTPATPYADVLGPANMASGPCAGRYDAEALRARCSALAAVLAFNDALAAEAAGADPAPWLRVARRNFAALSGLTDVLAAVAAPARKAAALVGELRASARLAEAAPAIREMIAALRADAPRLYALERAQRAERLTAADHAFLAAMDAVFDAARGRASPAGVQARAAFDGVTRRLAPILTRESPGYGAASLFDVMSPGGAALSGGEIAAMGPHIETAEAALAVFDETAVGWRGVAAAVRDYEALLAEVDATLGGGDGGGAVALFDRAGRIMAALGRYPEEVLP